MGIWQGPKDAEASAPLLVAIIAIAIAALTIVGTRDFALDDAWIHLAYAKSLRLGEGLSYNPGDWEVGFSSPAWVALLAVWPTDGNPVVSVKLLGALLHGLTAFLAGTLALHLARERARPDRPVPVLSLILLAGVLVATTPVLVHGATSGMEVPLAAAMVLASALGMVSGRRFLAAVASAGAVWSRPECFVFVVVVALPLAWMLRHPPARGLAARWGLAGAGVALTSWLVYCQVRTGQPWPNPQLIKGAGGGIGGLTYLAAEVLPWQPWLVSLTGVGLLAWALVREAKERRCQVLALVGAATATWIVVAVTRPLHPGVLFFESRYFAPFASVFVLALPFGLLGVRRWLGLALVVPVAIATGVQLADLGARHRDFENDTTALHTDVARFVAEQLPRDAVVAVEGAGALRYWTPRSMTIVDLVGLNDHRAAARHFQRVAKICHFVRQAPTHLVMPPDWLATYGRVFRVESMATFADPLYTQTDPPHPRRVSVYRVLEVAPAWQERCHNAPS